MARPLEEARLAPQSETMAAVEVIDLFLEWASVNRERPTYEACRRRLLNLVDGIPPNLAHGDLKLYHVTRVMDAKDWNVDTKNDFASAVQRAFNRAVEQGSSSATRSPMSRSPRARSGNRGSARRITPR